MVEPCASHTSPESTTLQQTKGKYMNKSLLTLAAVAVASVATPAMAGSLTAEVRLADVRNGNQPNSTEYKVEAWDSLYGVKVGAELQAKQGENAGPIQATLSAKAGLEGPTVMGVNSLAFVELGERLSQEVTTRVGTRNVVTGGNHEFWGVGVKLNRNLLGPVALNAGYRHREGFAGADNMNEERWHGGLTLAVNDKTAVGATYYNTRGTTNSDAVGLSVTRKF